MRSTRLNKIPRSQSQCEHGEVNGDGCDQCNANSHRLIEAAQARMKKAKLDKRDTKK